MQSEVNFLGRLSHPNLVKLLGYCWEEKELLLVYEFMQKGSLENHLFGSKQLLVNTILSGLALKSVPNNLLLLYEFNVFRGLCCSVTSVGHKT